MYNRQSCNIKRDGLTQVFSWMNLRSIEWSGVKKKKARYKNNAAELPFMQNWQNV